MFHLDKGGNKRPMVVRHMKAGDRDENHDLFVRLRGDDCLALCKKVLSEHGRKMTPRIPSMSVLEAYRPSYAKYFKKSEFGECSLCKPSYDNYKVFVKAVNEQDITIQLPDTISRYVCSRVCQSSTGELRPDCEELTGGKS